MSYPGSGGKVYTMGMGVFAYLRCFLVDAKYQDSFFSDWIWDGNSEV
jgi:hypothetical protein